MCSRLTSSVLLVCVGAIELAPWKLFWFIDNQGQFLFRWVWIIHLCMLFWFLVHWFQNGLCFCWTTFLSHVLVCLEQEISFSKCQRCKLRFIYEWKDWHVRHRKRRKIRFSEISKNKNRPYRHPVLDSRPLNYSPKGFRPKMNFWTPLTPTIFHQKRFFRGFYQCQRYTSKGNIL